MTLDRDQRLLPPHARRHIDTQAECWIWTGCVTKYGYGATSLNGRRFQAHRLVYWLLAEGPLPPVLHHRCENKLCVNPDHLQAESSRTNHMLHHHRNNGQVYHDRMRARTHCRNGHAFTPENTYWRGDRRGKVCRTRRAAHERDYRKRGLRKAAA